MTALFPALAAAELKSEMTAFVVDTDATGVEHYTAAQTVEPGQVIEYRLQHTNRFENAIGGVVVTGPVPAGSEFLPGPTVSDVPASFEVRGEFDPDRPGEEWSTLPAMRIVIDADGNRVIETASPEHYTAVRWVLATAVPEGGEIHHAYRVRVD